MIRRLEPIEPGLETPPTKEALRDGRTLREPVEGFDGFFVPKDRKGD